MAVGCGVARPRDKHGGEIGRIILLTEIHRVETDFYPFFCAWKQNYTKKKHVEARFPRPMVENAISDMHMPDHRRGAVGGWSCYHYDAEGRLGDSLAGESDRILRLASRSTPCRAHLNPLDDAVPRRSLPLSV
jgi:hypothetical protein